MTISTYHELTQDYNPLYINLANLKQARCKTNDIFFFAYNNNDCLSEQHPIGEDIRVANFGIRLQ